MVDPEESRRRQAAMTSVSYLQFLFTGNIQSVDLYSASPVDPSPMERHSGRLGLSDDESDFIMDWIHPWIGLGGMTVTPFFKLK